MSAFQHVLSKLSQIFFIESYYSLADTENQIKDFLGHFKWIACRSNFFD